jgi:HEAT repeat protein
LTDDPLNDLLTAIAAGDDARAEAGASAVGRLGDAALPALRDLQASAERDRRWWAARALAAVGTPDAVAALIAALGDPDPDVRACAVVGLAALRPAEAVAPLVVLLSDPSAYVARLTSDALAQFGQPATEPLIAALREGDAVARAGAARALSSIQPPEAIPALCAALDDPSAAVTYYAEQALERMGVGLVLFRP